MPAHFIAEEGPLAGLILNLDEGEEWIVGRDPDEADFVVEDSKVSRKHARITKRHEGFFIENLSRGNPLLINGAADQRNHAFERWRQNSDWRHRLSILERGRPCWPWHAIQTRQKEEKSQRRLRRYFRRFGNTRTASGARTC